MQNQNRQLVLRDQDNNAKFTILSVVRPGALKDAINLAHSGKIGWYGDFLPIRPAPKDLTLANQK